MVSPCSTGRVSSTPTRRSKTFGGNHLMVLPCGGISRASSSWQSPFITSHAITLSGRVPCSTGQCEILWARRTRFPFSTSIGCVPVWRIGNTILQTVRKRMTRKPTGEPNDRHGRESPAAIPRQDNLSDPRALHGRLPGFASALSSTEICR